MRGPDADLGQTPVALIMSDTIKSPLAVPHGLVKLLHSLKTQLLEDLVVFLRPLIQDYVCLVPFNGELPDVYPTPDGTDSDFDNYSKFGTSLLANPVPLSGITNEVVFTLNAAGRALITRYGSAVFGVRLLSDVTDNPPVMGEYGTENGVSLLFAGSELIVS